MTEPVTATTIATTATPGVSGLPALVPSADLVARIKSEIRLDDRAKLIDYGDQAQRNVTDYAERVLRQTKNKELGDTGELLTDIIAKANGLDPAALEQAGVFLPLLGSL